MESRGQDTYNSCRLALLRAIVGVMLTLSISGCDRSGPYADLKGYMDKVKAEQSSTVKVLQQEVKLPVSVAYDGNLRRSPFEDADLAANAVKVSATNPLQAYSLTMLRLLGTVTEKGVTVAYVTTPDNMVYRIQVGDIIGDHHGKVISIQPGAVNVMELDTDNPNDRMQRVVSLKLRDVN